MDRHNTSKDAQSAKTSDTSPAASSTPISAPSPASSSGGQAFSQALQGPVEACGCASKGQAFSQALQNPSEGCGCACGPHASKEKAPSSLSPSRIMALGAVALVVWTAVYWHMESAARCLTFDLMGLAKGSALAEAVEFFFYDTSKLLLLLVLLV